MAANNSSFFIQSNYGTKGNFDVVVPRIGGGLSHYYRDNDAPGFPWYGPFLMFGSMDDMTAAALIQSNFGNLEVVALEGSKLVHKGRNDGGNKKWSGETYVPGANNVTGSPGFIQSKYGTKGNFEVVAPLAAGGLGHWSRNNDAPGFPWSGPTIFGSGNVTAVGLFQNKFGTGHLEVIARVGTQLVHYWRDGGTGKWNGPSPPFASGVTGSPGFIQGNYGTKGNFEVVAPLAAGGLGHWSRNNDAPGFPWSGPTIFGSGNVTAVGLIQSNGGNLEVVARLGAQLVHYWRDDGGSWIWSGPGPFGEKSCNPTTGGEATIPFRAGMVGIHTALLHTGKLFLFGYSDYVAEVAESRVLDPVSGALTKPPETYDKFCSGHAFLSDGRLVIAGGHHHGHKTVHIFDPIQEKCTPVATMANGRWYPTCTTLPSGKVLTMSGTKGASGPVSSNAPVNHTLQIYDATTGLGPEEPLPSPFSNHFPPSFTTIDLYPFVYVLPSGKLLVHSRNTTRFYNPTTKTWDSMQLRTVYPYSRSYPGQGSSVLLPLLPTSNPPYRARVMVSGGGGADPGPNLGPSTPATNTVEILDLGAATPAWKSAQSMKFPRVMHDATLLPNGKVLVVGGSSAGKSDVATDPVLAIELFDPDTETWSTQCPMRVPRLYHAEAILLPDARVLIIGKDGIFNPPPYKYPEHRVEIFSPPYLFNGPRPVITTSPSTVGYNANFNVQSPDAASVATAAFLKLGSVTHSFNMDQRYVGLKIISQTSPPQLTLQSPPDANIAPPGYYMLFLVKANGVPSVAKIIQLK